MPTRWNTLRPIDEAQPPWLRHGHLVALRSVCSRIKARTGIEAYIDTRSRFVTFGVHNDGNVSLFDITCPLYRAPGVEGGFDPILDEWCEDEVVRVIRLAKRKASVKERWGEEKERAKKHAEAEEIGKRIESRTPQVEEILSRKRERRGMSRHFQKSHLVAGLKGTST